MYSIGLTGGIGSGKSRVADLLGSWGATLIDTDLIAHGLTGPGGAAMPALREAFGERAVDAHGALDRAWMRDRVFREPAERERLQAVLHPMIDQHTRRAAERADGPYVVYVVPLLVESGRWRTRVDRICVVDCDPDTQVARVQARSGLTPDAIRRIMAAQAARDTRLAAADDIIVNDGDTTPEMLHARTRRMHDRWIEWAAATGGHPREPGSPA
ncbi:dephospho-CoA kinase [Bordetella ansorpii]|uniref:Dephospho-CoA kinase n=1 Tax=Bordetella ansorpii TaxID=288768 RepID=A0A157SBP4_9BORD|nr:dephospho-CoA kinase [Bordetella ansorpii]SAI67858.1 dephospho-CoA kinase [Bordetella ansorpii]